MRLPSLAPAVLTWFDSFGRKNLPWQVNKTPYKVWLSEIMLQQTQVATVIPYFQRFITALPTVFDLAHADQDTVMHLWAGLGYYSRARNLHAAAKKVVIEHNGVFPADPAQLMQLPGIGRSTAAAIMSLAFDQPAAILDGNVKRVLARFCAVQQPINTSKGEALLWQLAENFVPKSRSADYTQAMMDLGATLCTRRQVQCGICPLHNECQARQLDLVDSLPIKAAKNKLSTKHATFLLYQWQRQILLKRNPAHGIWGGLWTLPQLAGAPTPEVLAEQPFLSSTAVQSILPSFRHTFSHYHLMLHPVLFSVRKDLLQSLPTEQDWVWYDLDQTPKLGLPQPIVKILRSIT